MNDALHTRVATIDRRLRAHAGGLALSGVSEDGVVTVRYTGMCTGCPLRPLTTAATVRPALLALTEVREVAVVGGRLSETAQQRIAAAFAESADCPGLDP